MGPLHDRGDDADRRGHGAAACVRGGHEPRWLGWISAFGVAALLAAVWGGKFLPGHRAGVAGSRSRGTTLAWWIMGYGLVASVLPVWLLLAPRDYLSTFMKIGTVAALGVAIVMLAPTLQMPALTRFIDGGGPVFAGPGVSRSASSPSPARAISGFHSLVASGTTPKLLGARGRHPHDRLRRDDHRDGASASWR